MFKIKEYENSIIIVAMMIIALVAMFKGIQPETIAVAVVGAFAGYIGSKIPSVINSGV